MKKCVLFFMFLSLALSHNGSAHIVQEACGPVERAGVILLKQYDRANPAQGACILVGKDARFDYVNFPAGECDIADRYSSKTAKRELSEETAKFLKLRGIKHKPFVYSQRHMIKLYLYRNDTFKVQELSDAVKAACADKSLPREFREINDYYAVPVQTLLNAAKDVIAEGIPGTRNLERGAVAIPACLKLNAAGKAVYPMTSRSGKNVDFLYQYLAAIAVDYANVKQKLETEFGCIFN